MCCEELKLDERKVVFINGDLNLYKNYDTKFNCIGFPWYFLNDKENLIKNIGYNPYKYVSNFVNIDIDTEQEFESSKHLYIALKREV